jgi:hypothetical protein
MIVIGIGAIVFTVIIGAEILRGHFSKSDPVSNWKSNEEIEAMIIENWRKHEHTTNV